MFHHAATGDEAEFDDHDGMEEDHNNQEESDFTEDEEDVEVRVTHMTTVVKA